MAPVAVILNSAASAHHKVADPKKLGDILASAGIEATIHLASGPGLAAAARQAFHARHRAIVAAGGDGTVSTVASVLVGHDTALGILPLGRLNHFAKDLRIPLEIAAAAQVIARGHAVPVDVADANGRTFINNASVGVYPRLVLERERQESAGHSYAVSLVLAILRVWRDYRRVRVAVRKENTRVIVRTPFVFVGNNEYQLEGIKFGGRKRLDGGCLHLCMAPDMTRADVIRVLVAALVGRLDALDRFESFTGPEFTVEAWRRQIVVSLDGEVAVLKTPLAFRIRPASLHVLVPEDAGAAGR